MLNANWDAKVVSGKIGLQTILLGSFLAVVSLIVSAILAREVGERLIRLGIADKCMAIYS